MEKNLQLLELYRSSHAQKWTFTDCKLSTDEVKAIAQALKKDKAVQALYLPCNKIGDAGAKSFAEALKVNTSLQTLILTSNKIGDAGAKSFAEALKVNTSLQELNLDSNNSGEAGNKIGDAGAKWLAEALKVNTSLQTLGLKLNIIGDAGAKSFAEAMQVNTSLQTLNLCGNMFGDEGAKWLAEAMQVNTSLQTLLVSGDNIGDAGAQLFAEAMQVNTSLQFFHLSAGNSHVKQMIEAALARNKQSKASGPSLPSPPQEASSQATPSGGTTGGSRHESGFVPGPATYVPISDFVMGFTPQKPCSQYLLDECRDAFEERDAGSGRYFPKLVEEATKVTASCLQSHPPPAGSPSNAFAITCYTMDLRHFGASERQNFFQILNQALQERNPSFLAKIQGYLFYLMSGLQALPTLSEGEVHTTFFRGLPASCLDILVKHYTRGRHIHWSGLTSVSRNIATAQYFAGAGGCIIQVDAFSARDISHLSAFPYEAEALLLPNFHAIVMKAPFKDEVTGYWHMEILEKPEETFVF